MRKLSSGSVMIAEKSLSAESGFRCTQTTNGDGVSARTRHRHETDGDSQFRRHGRTDPIVA